MTSETSPSVLIVGAGPVGLLLALLLSNRAIPVHIIDMAHTLDARPRATHYGSPAVRELERAGVLEDVRRQGFIPRGVMWRKLDGTPLAGLDRSCLPDIDAIHCLPLDRLGQLLLSRLEQSPLAQISWSHKVVEVGQDNDKAWVEVETPEGRKILEALYVVGCDGAKSQVRRSLFGDKSMVGKTWDHQLVATNVNFFPLPQLPQPRSENMRNEKLISESLLA
ncbi:6-hydroxy-3-succinoylpyridine 3-monooxygenase HspB [Talaromyces pinophilus]|nr:6-hydroxy-3-succinoylpyridine 3-monooxygenase HspB [Talaromyces pinophilus]